MSGIAVAHYVVPCRDENATCGKGRLTGKRLPNVCVGFLQQVRFHRLSRGKRRSVNNLNTWPLHLKYKSNTCRKVR